MNIPIVFEDEWIMVVNKPSGLLVIPSPRQESRTLTSILNQHCIDTHVAYRLHPCHRIDRETSGLVMYAKGKSAQEMMMELFRGRAITKYYCAYARGKLSDHAFIDLAIEGKAAKTEYWSLYSQPEFSVAKIKLHTGRTNQVRIHFKYIGHPLLGETKFAFRKDFTVKAKRLCLHAHKLEFKHPWTGKIVQLQASLPEDMQDFLKKHIPEGHSLWKNL